MNTEFVNILKKLVAEQGKEALLNPAKCKAFLADYTHGEYKKESRLLLQAIDVGVQKAIDTTDELEICKKQQIRILHEEHFLTAEATSDVVNTLALVLRGDTIKTKTQSIPSPVVKADTSKTVPLKKKKHTKRNLVIGGVILFLLTVFIIVVLPLEYKWASDGNGGVIITKYVGTKTEVHIPPKIVGYPVTSIGDNAFKGCTSLTSVTIPNSVTSIGSSAFAYCGSLTSITIPNSVKSIVYCVFACCTSLTSVTIPASVTSIGSSAFAYCGSLTSITIPNSVTIIGDNAFVGCISLTSIAIPASVTSIRSNAFSSFGYRSNLTSVTFQGRIASSSLSNNTFSGLGDLREKYLAGGIGTYKRTNGSFKWTKQ
jgi:hypothetical protein